MTDTEGEQYPGLLALCNISSPHTPNVHYLHMWAMVAAGKERGSFELSKQSRAAAAAASSHDCH